MLPALADLVEHASVIGVLDKTVGSELALQIIVPQQRCFYASIECVGDYEILSRVDKSR